MKEISTIEVQQRLENGEKLNLIDVREVAEIQEAHIPGIIHIPLGLLEFRIQELEISKPYIMVCRSGGRSGQATQYLEAQGFDVKNMTGGMLSWEGKVE
ncbi:rhodanese-like domain-containing protein [Ureibacillus chungkukjangi]|uniref:rhodanese-like domain-containing protein n=1 Tax=Ureibacillus chungkukjangi TaxID=1202712 RepID=UPI00203F9079|nr:rhodanese-like domain-containing protein [Ureibacillus chungkukjangi]MCM3386912.1 rhodanese-like domain-containing protein [Ureibacillus chungkukjangi]